MSEYHGTRGTILGWAIHARKHVERIIAHQDVTTNEATQAENIVHLLLGLETLLKEENDARRRR